MLHSDVQNAIILCLMQKLNIREIKLTNAEMIESIAMVTENFKYSDLFVGLENGVVTARIEER